MTNQDAIRQRWNSPPQFSVKYQRWQPKMSTIQDEAMRALAKEHPQWPFRKIDGRVLCGLRQRGWVQPKATLLTDLGLEVVKQFWPHYLYGEKST